MTVERRLSRRGVTVAVICALVVSFLQSPGRIAADTKLDLTANPIGFLARAAHLWTPNAPMGQVQNQAYGYFFPHGAFFALGDVLHLPPWVVQRCWWALLLVVGFVGIVRLAEAMRIGSPASRVIGGVIFVLSPRVLTTIGSISSETLPMVLAPWVLVPLVRVLDRTDDAAPIWRPALQSAAAVALMGAVNAVATMAALGVAVVWWLLHAPFLSSVPSARWWRFGAWWALGLAMACAWWVVPLLILSRVSPPFLDFIESSRVTTEWTSLTEVLRGTSSWTPFVSPERVAGAVLVTQPAAVLATGVLAAAGLAGLCMRHMPSRGRLVTVLVVGLLLMCLGFAGQLGSPIAESVRIFLDGTGAPLRNIHKFEPFIRIPLVLGVAHLLARVPLPGGAGASGATGDAGASGDTTVSFRETASAFAHPQRSRPVAAAIVVLVAVIGAGSLMWTGQLAPTGTYRAIPDYWPTAAKWLSTHGNSPDEAPNRALVVPGAPFADQLWGLTRDEPLQPLADDPWAVRDAIPLTPPGAIRALDSVQRAIADGRGSPGLAPTLAQQGIGFVVLRADLDPDTSRSARPLVAQQALDSSPGLTRVATFGPDVGPASVPGVVRDNGLRPELPAIAIYAVRSGNGFPGTGPVLVDADSAPRVAGGPEALAAIQEQRARAGLSPMGPAILDADARRAGLAAPGGVLITDSPTDRETDFGRVDDHSSAIRAPGDPRRTQNAVPDYPVDGQPLVHGEWLLDNRPGQVRVSASGSASDATQLGQTSPANSPAAAFDGDPDTAWVSSGLDSAVGQWLRLDFTEPRSDLALSVTTNKALGSDVSGILVSTEAGSSVTQGVRPGRPVTVTAPSGPTRWVQIRAISTADGLPGNQFAVGEVAVADLAAGAPLTIRHRVTLPRPPAGTPVSGWLLTQELGGRSACVADGDAVRCAPGLGLTPETPGIFTRALQVPSPVVLAPTVVLRPRSGDGLRALISAPGQVTADGPTGVDDPRGNAGAAVDGDVGTTWVAPETGASEATGDETGASEATGDETGASEATGSAGPSEDKKRAARPELVIRLPKAQRVERLRLVAPDRYPAAPRRVTVDLGTGTQVRNVGRDGVIDLDPAVTDRIGITVTKTADLIDVNSLGFARPAPAGISEVEISPKPSAPTAAADDDRVVEIGCDAGIGLTVSGQVIGLSARTTAGALRDGQPVVAHPCAPAPAVRLGAGEQELSVNPGSAFTVDQVSLPVIGTTGPGTTGATGPPPSAPRIGDWSATHRTMSLKSSAREQILVVPESTNTGWEANVDGRSLTPVVVNGWQQGWVVPAGTAGTVTLTYRFDSLYRWSLGLGLGLVALLLLAAFGPRRRAAAAQPQEARAEDPTRPWVTAAAGVSWLGASWLLTGWWGLAVSMIVGGVALWLRPRTGVVAVFVAMLLATLGLASGPWHASTGYTGFDWWVQLPALIAVSLTVWLVTVSDGASARARLRSWLRFSRERNHRRAGSSMKA
ncbi:Alpha-(1-_3)-arabinofuranosyltransferase [Gordonia insulae]|uniref:Alpha-(1->3)-arabinofuranosyltransferase n=1 Tax=Gordonia insulae TaxID=2420509 RepID=A0A3G8JNW4_9ACTN|nr:Alpha-(1->3)-arabinofuranosyltransferase [Gordonia insulae]